MKPATQSRKSFLIQSPAILLATLSLTALAPLLSGCQDAPVPGPAVQSTVSGLTLAQAVSETVPSTVEAVGSVRAAESASVAAQTSGRVLEVMVHAGDVVRAGQPLVRIDNTLAASEVARAKAAVASASDAVAAARAQASLAASTLQRYELLRTRKSVSPQEYDEVSRRAEAAEAQLRAAKSQQAAAEAGAASASTMAGYGVVRAPFAGLVTARMADPGTLAAPGVPLVVVDRQGPLQLQVSVDESQIAAVHRGQTMMAKLDGLPQAVSARVEEIVPAADPASHSFLVKLTLPTEPALRAGIYGSIAIPVGQRMATLIPAAAVVHRGSLATVWVVDAEGIATLRTVTLGAGMGNQVEALSGVSAGETLVLNPADRDLAGKRVEAAASAAGVSR
jgi:RND family efflux transporter MFP subunit